MSLFSSDLVILEMSKDSSSSPCWLKNLSSGDFPGTFLNLVFSNKVSKSSWMNLFTSGSLFNRHPAHDSMTADLTSVSMYPSSPSATSSSALLRPITEMKHARTTTAFKRKAMFPAWRPRRRRKLQSALASFKVSSVTTSKNRQQFHSTSRPCAWSDASNAGWSDDV